MPNELPIKLFCFESEDLCEGYDALFGLGLTKGRIVGTEKVYSSIWVKIHDFGDALVDFYETENELHSENPTLSMSLAQCYLTYSKVNVTTVDLVVNIMLHKVKDNLKRLGYETTNKTITETTAHLINVLADPNELPDEQLHRLINEANYQILSSEQQKNK